jgi:16S rRNA (adenine1518-N6/adenine1519-N6)-dimethyltransferase
MTEPTAFPDARVLLARYGLAAKKHFGQNFLVGERTFRAIVDATVGADDDWIVEIGAGLGTLTSRLAERVPEGKVIAVERDPDMIGVLRGELGLLDNVDIVEADAMRYDLASAARWRGDAITVCGNLPYHIASQILFRVLAARRHIRRAVVMVQREMADRIVAAPGSKAYGAFGVLMTTWADAKIIAKVGPGSFVPPPKIDSAVVRLVPLPDGDARVDVGDERHYAAVVHAAFAQRRKTLRNSLRSRTAPDVVEAALTSTGIDGGRRGSVADPRNHETDDDGSDPDVESGGGGHNLGGGGEVGRA